MPELPTDNVAEDRARPYDCLIISDLHLGSDMCQARLLESFLEWAATVSRELVINGDVFDDLAIVIGLRKLAHQKPL